jgi:hypothetical protein
MTAAKRVLQYLKATKHLRIHFRPDSDDADLVGYTDSDWANDKIDRKSIGSYVFLFNGGPISWQSRKQKMIATSTYEAEYTAFLEVSKEALWLRQLLGDITSGLKPEDPTTWIERLYNEILDEKANPESESSANGPKLAPTTVFADNTLAIDNVKTEGITARNKHFELRLFKSRELQRLGVVNFIHVPSEDNTADGLTKVLARPAHEVMMKQLSLQH